MRCSSPVLAREWRQRAGGLDALLEATAQHARQEVDGLLGPAGADGARPGHETS